MLLVREQTNKSADFEISVQLYRPGVVSAKCKDLCLAKNISSSVCLWIITWKKISLEAILYITPSVEA